MARRKDIRPSKASQGIAQHQMTKGLGFPAPEAPVLEARPVLCPRQTSPGGEWKENPI